VAAGAGAGEDLEEPAGFAGGGGVVGGGSGVFAGFGVEAEGIGNRKGCWQVDAEPTLLVKGEGATMNRSERPFGLLAICLQLISGGLFCALQWTHRSLYWVPGKHLTRLDRVLDLSSIVLLTGSLLIAVVGMIRDPKRGLAIIAFGMMFLLAMLMGGFHGIS
jgi:hypothetical protein